MKKITSMWIGLGLVLGPASVFAKGPWQGDMPKAERRMNKQELKDKQKQQELKMKQKQELKYEGKVKKQELKDKQKQQELKMKQDHK